MYITILIILLTLAGIELIIKKNKQIDKKIISIFAMLILILFSSLRWKTGNDWDAYYDFYQSALSLSYRADTYEIGFRILVQFCKEINLDYTGFLFIVTTLQLFGFYKIFNKFPAPTTCVLMFFCSYYLGFIATIRQTIAVSFILLSFCYRIDLKNKKSLLFIFIASLFHYSAIICIITLFIPQNLKSLKFYIVFLTGVLAISLLLITPLLTFILSNFPTISFIKKMNDYYTIKSSLGEQEYLSTFWYIKRVFFLAFFYFITKKIANELSSIYNLYYFGAIFFFAFFNVIPMLAIRGGEYFNILEVIFISTFIYKVKIPKLIKVIFLLLFSTFRLYSSIYNYHPDLYVPYYSIFEKSDAIRKMY